MKIKCSWASYLSQLWSAQNSAHNRNHSIPKQLTIACQINQPTPNAAKCSIPLWNGKGKWNHNVKIITNIYIKNNLKLLWFLQNQFVFLTLSFQHNTLYFLHQVLKAEVKLAAVFPVDIPALGDRHPTQVPFPANWAASQITWCF